MPLSWTSPASGGAVSSYSVRWSPHAANVWTTVANISGTSTTITGLTVSTSYDFEVQAVNAGGNGGWTAAINALTTGGGNYLLTAGFLPAAGSTWQVNATAIGVNSNDNSATVDGSHTVPASVTHAWSTSNTAAPTTGLQPASQFSNGGHNYWATYMTAPRHSRQLLPLGHRQGLRGERRRNLLLADSFHRAHVIDHGRQHSLHPAAPC